MNKEQGLASFKYTIDSSNFSFIDKYTREDIEKFFASYNGQQEEHTSTESI